MNYQEAMAKLKTRGQEHVLKYYDELNAEEQKALLSQVEKLDLSR